MKLIINISDESYDKALNGIINCKECFDAIVYGTPIPDNATNVLDAIKLEIKQEYDNQGDWSFNDGLAFALDIIDKYLKGEQEC